MSLATLLLTACAAASTTPAPSEGTPERALTLYQQGFAVVREPLQLDLVAGSNPVSFSGATAMVEADSVLLRGVGRGPAFRIREQGYRNDPVSQGLLLWLFEGQSIDFRSTTAEGAELLQRGRILRSGYKDGSSSPLIEVSGKLRFSLPGEPLFPALPDDAILLPTLTWVLESESAGRVAAELSYVSNGFGWSADYNAVISAGGDALEWMGWVTLHNRSGKHFDDARIKLIAGEVQREVELGRGGKSRFLALGAPSSHDAVEERSFDEYHLYALPGAMRLRDQESKQVEFVRAPAVPARTVYVYDGADLAAWQGWDAISRRSNYDMGAASNDKVRVLREFENSTAGGLGVPLPAGRVRFYKLDLDGRLEFVGEDRIDHTPKDERVRLATGSAFDIKGERKRTQVSIDENRNMASESFRIEVRNRKQQAVEVQVVEHLLRWTNWNVVQPSQPFTKVDAETIRFDLQLGPNATGVVEYRVDYSW